MASKSWSDFFDWVLPHVPGCIQPVAEDAIREAAIDFCDATLIFKRDLSIDTVAGGTGLYDLDGLLAAQYTDGDQVSVISIQDGFYNGNRIYAATDAELAAQYGCAWDSTTGCAKYFNMKDESTARFAPIPDCAIAAGILITVALVPEQTASLVDDFLWSSYRQEIAGGALALLMMSPKKPYTNYVLGAQKKSSFEMDCSIIATAKKNNYTRKPLRSAPSRA